jgi:hypothetical protein
MPKKYITVQLEIDYFTDEFDGDNGLEYHDILESVLPVSVDTHNLSPAEVYSVYNYLRRADDAEFDLMWELKGLLSDKASEKGAPK